jgi:hypothetical protein
MRWPPKNQSEIFGLLQNVQMAHIFVVAMSTGARRSEILTLGRDCIVYGKDDIPHASGRTFKLVQRHEGVIREWVLPELAVQAIEQQVRIIELVETIGTIKPKRGNAKSDVPRSNHLWGQVSSSGSSDRSLPLLNISRALWRYAKCLGMDINPGGQLLRTHRFRKTLARLVALALTQAPKILKDVFGHRNIEMTLYYVLCDKNLRADAEQISRELRIMRATEVVSKMVEAEESAQPLLPLGGYGGPAALMIMRSIETHRNRVVNMGEDWGANTPKELAEVLTLQGKAWQVVRHGVICTKFNGSESGPCNLSLGRPQPARCQSNCVHRLEEGFLREDVDQCIALAVKSYEAAIENEEDLMQSYWAGQILVNLGRFGDIRAKWLKNDIVSGLTNVDLKLSDESLTA